MLSKPGIPLLMELLPPPLGLASPPVKMEEIRDRHMATDVAMAAIEKREDRLVTAEAQD